MKWKILLILLFASMIATAQVQVGNLRVENLSDPLGIDINAPLLSWQLTSTQRNTMQSAYEVWVDSSASFSKLGVWHSGKISSSESVHVPYSGATLASSKKYYWKVRVWDNQNKPSTWSRVAVWQMGLLHPEDWKAQWIEAGYAEDSVMRPSPMFRKEFRLHKKIKIATLFITSHGLYEGYINGKRIGNDCLTPGWTSYNKRLQYQVYDVSDLLANGDNAIGVMLGSGWYRGQLAWGDNNDIWGKSLALLCQLQIDYSDGSKELMVSDNNWKSSTGTIRYSEIYNGEISDARQDKTGWMLPRYDDAGWSSVVVKNHPKDILAATFNEPVRRHEMFAVKKIITTPKGETVLDFGQNLVGFAEVRVSGKKGDSIILRHAEVLDKEGNFYTDNLRGAREENSYVLNGEGEEIFHPHFSFQGFRYVRIDKFSGKPDASQFTAVALYSDMKPTGSFVTSDSLINQLQHNIQWGQRGNFLDVPTDCPQRDERLGWTGDAQAFSRTASFNFGVDNFFEKWLRDVAADQLPDGSIPFVIPNSIVPEGSGSAGWSDAATIIPWNLYLAYGNKRVLQQQYESMKKWVDFIQSKSTNYLWNTGFHFGDWLYYHTDDEEHSAATDKYMIAQCFYAHSIQMLLNAAQVLQKSDDVKLYNDLLGKVKQAYLDEYATANGRLVSASQTAYVLALQFDMLPKALRPAAAQRLVENIRFFNNHLTTGFLGTPYLCHVLSRFGYTNVAYQLLMQKTYPSWLYPVTMGATTIWERWDGIRPDSSFQAPIMNSFNHYAYGAVGDWMYRVVAGIDTYNDAPGYKHIRIMPHADSAFTFVQADYKTNYGQVSSRWKREASKLILQVEIPANTTATVYIPASSADKITEGGVVISKQKGIVLAGIEDGYMRLEVGSGKYEFTVIQ